MQETIADIGDGATGTSRTSWTLVSLALLAGVLAATQIGAAHSALPVIRRELHLSLVAGAWVVSGINVVGLLGGALISLASLRFGLPRFITFGFVILALSAFWGAGAAGQSILVLSRLLEGVGFVMIIIGAPSMITVVTRPKDRQAALAAWGAYMPAGIALATWFGPAIMVHAGWRGLWRLSGLVLLVFGLLFFTVTQWERRPVAIKQESSPISWHEFGQSLLNSDAIMLALIFGCFTVQHQGTLAMYPSFLQDHYHLAPQQAGHLASIAMFSNIAGSVGSGLLLRSGVSSRLLMTIAFVVMAAAALGTFALGFPWQGSFACAFALSCVGGLIPGCVLAKVPECARSSRDVPIINGVLVQGSKLGLVTGPVIVSAIATRLNWTWVPLFMVAAAALGLTLVWKYRR